MNMDIKIEISMGVEEAYQMLQMVERYNEQAYAADPNEMIGVKVAWTLYDAYKDGVRREIEKMNADDLLELYADVADVDGGHKEIIRRVMTNEIYRRQEDVKRFWDMRAKIEQRMIETEEARLTGIPRNRIGT